MMRPDHGHGPHPHRSWLHLLSEEPEFVPREEQLRRAEEVLVASGLALRGSGELIPGPQFQSLLEGRRAPVPMGPPSRPRGEVRVESGILRCYPDPGPQGFESEPVRHYLAPCPLCGSTTDFFLLRFPFPDPLLAACPSCQAQLSLVALPWDPELPWGRMEITFGDLESRPSLRQHQVFTELEVALGTRLREVHVTL